MLLCLSNKQTLRIVDKMGLNHDGDVLQWRDNICSRKLDTQVNQLAPTYSILFSSVPSTT